MKTIRIERMTLENFKNHAALQLDFRGRDATIYGDNATGKTSVYDALTWLLFGKDSHGNGEKSIDIKPLDERGEVRDHEAITTVEVVLSVDNGPEITLRKSMRENWTTRRGSSQTVYDGNVFEYAVDGVPMKKNEFSARVREIVDEDVFSLLTSVTAFAQDMDWRKRRELLFELSGVSDMSDKALMAQTTDFSDLAEVLGSRTLDELRKVLQGQRRNLKDVRDRTPARLNELEKQMQSLQMIDFAAAESALNGAKAREDALREQLASIRSNSGIAGIEQKKQALRTAMEQLETENRLHRRQQEAAVPDRNALQAAMAREETRITALKSALQLAAEKEIAYEKGIEDERERWISENAKTFTGGVCPSCGQSLPVEKLKAATERFDREKASILARIERSAADYKSRLEALRREMIEDEKARKTAEDALEALLQQYQAAELAAGQVTDLPDYAARRDALSAQIAAISGDAAAAGTALAAQTQEIILQLREEEAAAKEANEKLAQRATQNYLDQRINDLRAEQKRAAIELEKIDRILFLMEEFIRWKTRFVEDSVNSLFRVANFRLFREQANGGLEERCDVTVGGVPYASLNSGMKINAGIDLINALSRYFGVQVPLFVDNAESVTQLEFTDTQVVRLVVSENDPALRMEVAA